VRALRNVGAPVSRVIENEREREKKRNRDGRPHIPEPYGHPRGVGDDKKRNIRTHLRL